MNCRSCGSHRLKFIERMTNVEKYRCRDCGKNLFVPLAPEKIVESRILQRQARRVMASRRRSMRHHPEGSRPSNCYAVFNHQNKGDAFIRAIENDGRWQKVFEASDYRALAFVLTDSDIMGRTYRLDKFRRLGCKNFFVIPHTARPNLVNDILPTWRYTTAQFVVARGHIEVLRKYGYTKPLHVVGWNLCPMKKFQPKQAPRNVLFAPIHPRCSKIDQNVNKAAFDKLYKLAKNDDIILTVRFIRSLTDSGLQQVTHPNVKYITGHMDQNYEAIDKADVVVGHQTVAWLAVARGVPTLMMAEEDLPTHIQVRGRSVQYAKHWKDYVSLIAYPFDILNCDDTLGLLLRAVESDDEIKDWKSRMIGQPFRPDRFISALEKYL